MSKPQNHGSESESGSEGESEEDESESGTDEAESEESGSETGEFDNEELENDSDHEGDEVESELSDQELLMQMAEESDEETKIKKPISKKKKTEDMLIAAKELPFTFEAPANGEEFAKLIDGQSLENQITIIKRLQVLYNVKLSPENNEKIQTLLMILLEHVIDTSAECLNMDKVKGYLAQIVEIGRGFPTGFGHWCTARLVYLRDSLIKKPQCILF